MALASTNSDSSARQPSMAPSVTLPESPVSVGAEELEKAWQKIRDALVGEQTSTKHWVGQLSTSALSTATAISAWSLVRKHNAQSYAARSAEIDQSIHVAAQWLIEHQNHDGGFGDTDQSHSNIATSLLALAAWQLAGFQEIAHAAIERCWAYCERVGKWAALRKRYGKDKTFVAPILTNCALAGIVSWDDVPTLPFEAAWLPQRWYRLARMPVVSYAVPALVAIGQARFYHRPPMGPWRYVRQAAIKPTLDVLDRMQPSSGGYLEAVPLTSFVLMCLADIGQGDHPVAQRAVDFLLASRLSDGSLPIDTNLATWTTSLSISAIEGPSPPIHNDASSKASLSTNTSKDSLSIIEPKSIRWLLSCQHWSDHPFTGASPGGWGWSNLSGAVPDADDTPAALIALARWYPQCNNQPMLKRQIDHAVNQGLVWLLNLQNGDGGWPTFCRGWGKLPFDRSGSDLTAHAIRAITAWQVHMEAGNCSLEILKGSRPRAALERGFQFLEKRQNPDGSWFPLWFGNQDRTDEENPVYGTAKVLLAYGETGRMNNAGRLGISYLVNHQNVDGGWGGGPSVSYRAGQRSQSDWGSSVEETGYALEALLIVGGSETHLKPTIMRALRWMIDAVDADCFRVSWPIGFYFAKLWYHERLYPMIACASALNAARRLPHSYNS